MTHPILGSDAWRVIEGDCLDTMRSWPDNCIDAVVTDPPAGISFMGKAWDHHKGGRDQWIAWLAEVMREALRVLKPGGHAFVWALPRTAHWTGMALEDAGFEVRDSVFHLFGSGFPKSLDVSKAIDAANGDERERVLVPTKRGNRPDQAGPLALGATGMRDESFPASAASAAWDGWGTALKPAAEVWWLARKPLIGTVAQNVRTHGTGGINVDGCRVGFRSDGDKESARPASFATARESFATDGPGSGTFAVRDRSEEDPAAAQSRFGRWPANAVLSHSPGCVEVGERKVATGTTHEPDGPRQMTVSGAPSQALGRVVTYADPDGTETIAAWRCEPDCAVRMLDAQSGECSSGGRALEAGDEMSGSWRRMEGRQDVQRRASDYAITSSTGGASRFFYCAKVSREEREAGMREAGMREAECRTGLGGEMPTDDDGNARDRFSKRARNIHPTVKPIALMRWLARLVTPPGVPYCPRCGVDCTNAIPPNRNGPVPPLRRDVSRGEQAEPGSSVLQQDLRLEVAGCDAPGVHGDDEGIHSPVSSGPSELVAPRLHYGASRGDGGKLRTPTKGRRGSAPQEREEVGQPTGQSPGDAEAPSRSGTQEAGAADQVPALQSRDPSEGEAWRCGDCGGPLERLTGVVLDPFCGSGSTGCAAIAEGFRFIGIEREPEYHTIAVARIRHADRQPSLFQEPQP